MVTTSIRFKSASLFATLAITWMLATGVVLTTISGCGDDEETCSSADDCPGDQVCVAGTCYDRSSGRCDGREDCDRGEVCESGYCVPEDGDVIDDTSDMGEDVIVDIPTEPEVTPDVVVDRPPDQIFEDPPQVVSTTPADLATSIAINASVSITFDQPMVSASFSPNTRIQDYQGTALSRAVAYDSGTWTVTLSPTSAEHYFAYAAPYTVTIDDRVSGENGLYMEDDFSFTFSTVNFTDMTFYDGLAAAYAPVVYAEVRSGTAETPTHRIDWFTSVNFDSNLIADDNLSHATPPSRIVIPHVYYNVLETVTHYFIQYVFYYPVAVNDRNDSASDAVEHDFSYSLVVVQKLDDDPLGRFVMAEGLGDAQVWAFALTEYPTDCGGEEQPVCGGIENPSEDIFVKFSPDLLEPSETGDEAPGRRYPVYVATGGHANCIAPAYDPIGTGWRTPNRCAHNLSEGAPFYADNADWSRVLRPGDGDRWTIAEEAETNELTYTMSSFIEGFWVHRGNDNMFPGARNYTPPPESGTDEATVHPTWLDSDDSGDPSRNPPFVAEADVRRYCEPCSHVGVWFADPAFEVAGHTEFDHDYSNVYCFNPFLGIDERDSEDCQ